MITNSFYQPQKYYALLTSLPDLVLPLPVYKSVPLTDDELENRLKMLSEEDNAEVVKTVNFLTRQTLDGDDNIIKRDFDTLLTEITHTGLQKLLKDNMRMRTVIAALLRSCSDEKLPTLKSDEEDDWGYDAELMNYIRENWSHPNFELTDAYPNIIPLRRLTNKGEVAKMNDWVEEVTWNYYIDRAEEFEFSVENVVLFLVQRQMIKNKLERNADKTTEIMKETVNNMIDKMELNL